MRGKIRYWVALAVLAAAAEMTIGIWQASAGPAQFTLRMTPVTPLTVKACVPEARHYGYSASAGAIICTPGEGRGWYRATLTNDGSYGLPACTATGFDTHGTVVAGRLSFEVGGIRGLFVPGHHSLTFYRYLPHRARGPVARYTAACSAVPDLFNA